MEKVDGSWAITKKGQDWISKYDGHVDGKKDGA